MFTEDTNEGTRRFTRLRRDKNVTDPLRERLELTFPMGTSSAPSEGPGQTLGDLGKLGRVAAEVVLWMLVTCWMRPSRDR
jgi:hypothetical protein